MLSTGILFLGLALVLSVWMKKQQKNRKIADALERSADHMHKEDLELPLFDLGTLAFETPLFLSFTRFLTLRFDELRWFNKR